jgi:hypothetical protein
VDGAITWPALAVHDDFLLDVELFRLGRAGHDAVSRGKVLCRGESQSSREDAA